MMLIIAHLRYTEPGWSLDLLRLQVSVFIPGTKKQHYWRPFGRMATCQFFELLALIFRQWSHLPVCNNKREDDIMKAQE